MMSNDTVVTPGPVQPIADRQPDFALSRADFIFEIVISPWKSGPATGTRDSSAKSTR
ncbi:MULTISPECIES: hypothetical protein [Paraburkholderia]|uniref:Uncharacterized protein n=1 Tax=Paraburkholderia guartelaensis TaxID=2546446 RepID=A0ABU9SBW3_9BURK|nr:hypothetical protein [Paraburkholderia nodosa]